jgi:CheY-like chemotaxis protein
MELLTICEHRTVEFLGHDALLISQAGKSRAARAPPNRGRKNERPMNDFHVTENAMAESGKATNAGDIDLPYARSADQPATRVDRDEDSGIRKFRTGGGRRKTGNQRTVLYVDDNPKALRMLKFVIEGSGYKAVTARDAGETLERMRKAGVTSSW